MLTAVITGVAGQDGSYLAELLLSKGYAVIGILRRKSTGNNLQNLSEVIDNENFTLVYGDLTDSTFIYRVLYDYKPVEWYNLAAMSHVGQSFKEPVSTYDINAISVLKQLEAIRLISPYTKFYEACTSEVLGGVGCPKEGYTEESMFYPKSPYGVAKLSAFWSTKNYREAYNLFACSGILHNHSSPRRGIDFATRKITKGVANIRFGNQKHVSMGTLTSFRDEGHSKDYVKAMHLMLQQKEPEDFLIATGKGATIGEMLQYCCDLAGLNFDDVYERNELYCRPSEVNYLLGNPKKAKEKLGWEPVYTWQDLLKEMYLNDVSILKNT
jgi:GDPmannose 4,6-dehydratase